MYFIVHLIIRIIRDSKLQIVRRQIMEVVYYAIYNIFYNEPKVAKMVSH